MSVPAVRVIVAKVYDFNTATKLNSQLVKALMNTGQLVAVIGDLIVGTGDRSLSRRKRQKYNLIGGTLTEMKKKSWTQHLLFICEEEH